MYCFQIFVPILTSFTQNNIKKNIKVIRNTDRYDVVNKCVQIYFEAETGYEGDNNEGVNAGDRWQGDKSGEEESGILSEKIEYILKFESLE